MTRSVVQDSDQKDNMTSYEDIKMNLIKYGKPLIELGGLYFVWILLHYICSHLYVSWCTPLTIIGFILSPFVVPAPHCQALRWVIVTGSNSITAMWFALGAWFAKKLVL